MKLIKSTRFTKIFALITVVALATAILIGGTYALQDFNQHKTNILGNVKKNIDVTLNETFNRDDDWIEGETAPKKVSVSNLTTAKEPVFVRLALKEYMDIMHTKYEYAMDGAGLRYRFLTFTADSTNPVGKKGEFVAFPSQAAAETWANANGWAGRVVGSFTNGLDPNAAVKDKWYIWTQFGDKDGQYGKYLVTGIVGDPITGVTNPDGVELVAGKDYWTDMPESSDVGEFASENGDDFEYLNFARYLWVDQSLAFNPATHAKVREYVKMVFGADVITLSEWKDPAGAYKGLPVAKWIYDDTAGTAEPYVYWGQPLLPGNNTTNFLEGVTLIKQPEEVEFHYAIRVDMESVIRSQLDDLTGMPPEIRAAYDLFIVDSGNYVPFLTPTTGATLTKATNPPSIVVSGPKTEGAVLNARSYLPSMPENGFTIESVITVPSVGHYPHRLLIYAGLRDTAGNWLGQFMINLAPQATNITAYLGGHATAGTGSVTVPSLNYDTPYAYKAKFYKGTDNNVWVDVSVNGVTHTLKTFESGTTCPFSTDLVPGFGYYNDDNSASGGTPAGQFTINKITVTRN